MPHTAHSERDLSNVMNYINLTQTLVDSFHALADEVQALTDRKTILEHKLRFAHEQYQFLADKYAPNAPDIAETLAKLQLPSDLPVDDAKPVPLPRRNNLDTRNQLALLIRDGRRSAKQLSALVEPSKTSVSSRGSLSCDGQTVTSMSTALEQDFTIEGKKGQLQCPFSAAATPKPDMVNGHVHDGSPEHGLQDTTPHHSADPICAAMLEEATSQQAQSSGNAAKCPIRYLDQHSPEEIAHYVETHKHELPRSHEVCVRRYQRSEDQIRKLDAKYGNLVSMVQGLSTLHKPMLPTSQMQEEIDKASNERVENWAHAVTSDATDDIEEVNSTPPEQPNDADDERQGHFDRPLKEVRVGESPSRPWGISVPVYETHRFEDEDGPPLSPPPAPVVMPTSSQGLPTPAGHPTPAKAPGGKCPFDHTKLAAVMNGLDASPPAYPKTDEGKDPEPQQLPATPPLRPVTPPAKAQPAPPSLPKTTFAPPQPTFVPQSAYAPQQPTFINPSAESLKPGGPQMVFTGPVFIGYPIEQAIQFMQHFQGQRP
ncbi:hypothetical protein VD0004_g614 [Verticillium dahliae]|uniref:Uncharacterized protein n=1 Tax=Verticillium dahliae TaxID=27337 RepID=A0A444S3B5_VERDA|nr:hypothetical protein VD0004_g614 [Verticillium dahliae]PNH76967.1 hypothetical protein VD0001_g533 [Verticillium dahliae]RXG47878.1 hypothetical protein VDGE_04284 [Verticillium dahliae]